MTCIWPFWARLQDQHLPAKVEIRNVQILRGRNCREIPGWVYVLKHVRTVYIIIHNTTIYIYIIYYIYYILLYKYVFLL